MSARLGLRLARVGWHIAAGLATCALVLSWAGPALREACIRRWSARLLQIFSVSIVADGAPPHAGLVVANHVSWLDIFVLNAIRPCRFVAKSEVRRWPVLGWLVKSAGTVFLERRTPRDVHAIAARMADALAAGDLVAFFPEGTSSPQGQLLPFHANLFEAAIRTRVEVHPVALAYHDVDGALHPAVDYVGDMTLLQSIVALLSHGPIEARPRFLQALTPAHGGRRELAKATHSAVAGALARSRRPARVEPDRGDAVGASVGGLVELLPEHVRVELFVAPVEPGGLQQLAATGGEGIDAVHDRHARVEQ